MSSHRVAVASARTSVERSGHTFLAGARVSYADLSLFQVVEGLAYAFPRATQHLRMPRVRRLHAAVKARPRMAAYLASPRRIAFNEEGIFRHYDELDAPA